MPKRKPIKAPNPAFSACLVSLPPNNSPINAPANGPIITPQGGNRKSPANVPIIQPQFPQPVPPKEMSSYSTSLSSLTGGRASFIMKFASYELVPTDVQEKLMKEFEAKENKDD